MYLREIDQIAPKMLRINYELTRHAPSVLKFTSAYSGGSQDPTPMLF
jgi:hypothetical protein